MRSRTAAPNRSRAKVVFAHRINGWSKINVDTDTETDTYKMAAAATENPMRPTQPTLDADAASRGRVPHLFASNPPIRDTLETGSSRLQEETIKECLPFLADGEGHENRNDHGIPHLYRRRHVKFLRKQLGLLPSGFTAADASRPWFFYWCLNGLALLGEDVGSYRSKLVETVRPMQNPTGGFAGGFGQASHLATTYATILSLALVGGPDAYEVVERRAIWKWLCSLKQPDGGFQMAIGGEEDVRGAYCAAVIISLLDLPLDLSSDSPAQAAGHTGLFDGLGEWVQRCQTYEGGVSAKPGIEAHGAYAFCALGCLSIIDSPHRAVPKYLHVPRLLSWLSSRQYAPEGGFSGRTNKLVDGCYSHWVGGCWPLIEAALDGPPPTPAGRSPTQSDASLYSRNGLIRYILTCGQDLSSRGGLRDKPSKYSDAYHTCYVLSGLSSAQHKWTLDSSRSDAAAMHGDVWVGLPHTKGEQIFDEEDRVGMAHPVYVIPQQRVEDCQQYFASKQGF